MSSPSISVISPVGQAWERTQVILFRPFDATKWFTIGFCAWLAFLGRRAFSPGFNLHHPGHADADRIRDGIWQARDYVLHHLDWIVPAAALVLAVGLGLWVCLTWLNSRGAFMFLECVARNRAAVVAPWARFRPAGHSLFGFRLALGLLGMAVGLPLFLAASWQVLRMFLADAWPIRGIVLVAALAAIWFGAVLAFGLVRKLTDDFVVPLMYRRRLRCWDAWTALGRLLAAQPGEFVLYLLFQIPLAIGIGIIVLAAVVLTCCVAGCLLALPYLGTVLLLPVLVFLRSYSIYYLAQFGPDCDVFVLPEPPVAAPSGP